MSQRHRHRIVPGRGLFPLVAGAALALPSAARAQGRAPAPAGSDTVPIDRWLVSTPFPADSSRAPLQREILGPPGATGVLPDRGGEEAGATWRLARRDGSSDLPLDSALAADSERPARSVVFAHSYIRFPEDRTVLLAWGGRDCTRARAWLNGRPLARSGPDVEADRVRMGRGWNTFLVEALEGDCPFGVRAELLRDGADGAGLGGVEVQASRPPGDTRTGPSPWVLLDPKRAVPAGLAWRGDRLLGDTRLVLVAWSPTPVARVEVKAKADGEEDRAALDWLTPGTPTPLDLRFPLDRLARAADGSGLELEIEWDDAKRKLDVPIDGPLPEPSRAGAITLLGWRSNGDGAALPDSGGVVLSGEWKVPEALAGRDLTLDVSGAPGAWSVDGAPAPAPAGAAAPLCARCAKGRTLKLAVRVSDAWTDWPSVRVGEAP